MQYIFVSLKLVKHEIEVKENYYNSINEPKVAAEIIKDFIGDRDRECMVVLSLKIMHYDKTTVHTLS